MGDTNSEAKAPKKSYFAGLKAEFNKIIWPDKMSVAKQTTAVVAVSVALGVIIKIVDMLVQLGLDYII